MISTGVSSFLNIRVTDVHARIRRMEQASAHFLTPPKQHQYEIRCYLRDPDGHLIEVGQTTDTDGDWSPTTGHQANPNENPDPQKISIMTTAIIGTGGIGSAIARQLASGGETLQLSSADKESARKLAAAIGEAASVASRQPNCFEGSRCGCSCASRFSVLKDVIDEIADACSSEACLVVPSNPVGLDAQGNVVRLLPEGQSSGEVVAGWLPAGTPFAIAFGTMSADLFESSSHRSPERTILFYVSEDDRRRNEVEHLIRTAGFEPLRIGGIEQSSRLEVGGDLHDLVVSSAQERSLVAGA